jgi:predicted dehydrogenase
VIVDDTREGSEMLKQVGIGIIGAGRIADVMATAYSSIGEVSLVAVADIVRRAAEGTASRFSIKNVFEDYSDLLAQPEVDAVLICAPTFFA